jgi:hypothetical protein
VINRACQVAPTGVYRPVTGEPSGWNAYAFFNDLDSNGLILQQSPGDE